MAWKLFISSIILLLSFGCYTFETTSEVKPDDDSRTLSLKISSCLIGAAELRDVIKCNTEKGDKGVQGLSGTPGQNGIQGLTGPQGPEGLRGKKGETGLPGPKGESSHGLQGIKGEQGETGKDRIGDIGKKGTRGPSGSAGLAGTCPLKVYVENTEDELNPIGTADNPSNFLCHTVFHNTNKNMSGEIWVFKGNDKFKVKCQEKTKRTCLILPEQKYDYIQDKQKNSINYKNEVQSFWLSNKTKYGFDLTTFYNVTMKQIEWLQSKSTQVIQRINYYCKNSYVAEYNESALRLLSWNDLVIGPYTTNYSPLSYSLPPGSHGCTEEASKTEWGFTEILITGSSKRLPVIDFHIRDIRREDQRFYLELTELCFG